MKARLFGFWSGRSRREQVLIAWMLVLFALVIGWIGIARPLAAATEDARLRYEQAALDLGEARRRAAVLAPVEDPRRFQGALEPHVRQSVERAGFRATVAGAGTGQLRVDVDAARAPALFNWLDALRADGIEVVAMQARPNPDRTLRVRLRLGARR